MIDDALDDGARMRPSTFDDFRRKLRRLQDTEKHGVKLRAENLRRIAAAGKFGCKIFPSAVARLKGMP